MHDIAKKRKMMEKFQILLTHFPLVPVVGLELPTLRTGYLV
jgi:hypothetical protein